jgi:hypothetical protein
MEQSRESYAWAEQEFGGSDLGDVRRTRRLVQIAAGVSGQVGSAVSSVCGKSGAQAVSRLFDRPETCLGSVSAGHVAETRKRCFGAGRILAIQDTTTLDFSSHRCTEGLGPVSGDEAGLGLLMHSVVAASDERVPLGILGLQVWSRDVEKRGIAKDRRKRPVSEKESQKWLTGLDQAQSGLADGQSMLVIGDRESDVYALFVAPRVPNVDLLIRVAHNRGLAEEGCGHLREAVASAPLIGVYDVEVPRQGSRAKRTASLEVRVLRTLLRPPVNGADDVADAPVAVSLIWAVERNVPIGVKRLDWTLLTTGVVEDFESAVDMIRCYTARWLIEEFHRVLKSGCRIEQVQFETVDRILPVIGLLCIVAWRVLHLTKLSRSDPDLEVMAVASPDEVVVLSKWLEAQGDKLYEIRSAREFNIAVARLGGFQGRKSDGMPGTKTTWQGLRNLEMLVLGHRLATTTRCNKR